MKLQLIRKSMVATALLGGLLLANCGSDEADTSDASTGQTVDGAAGSIDARLTGDSGVVSDSGVASDAAVGSVTFGDVHPIYQAKCGPCHTEFTRGGHNIGHTDIDMAYDFSQLSSSSVNGTKGEATLFRIKNGSMPRNAGCSGNPAMDTNNSACLTQAQQDLIQAWLDDGQLR